MPSEMPSVSQGTGNAPLNKESAPLVYPTRVRTLLGLPDRSDGITPSGGPMLSQELPYVGQDAELEASEPLDAWRESKDSKFEWPEAVEESPLTTQETVLEEEVIGEQTNLMIPGISKPQNFSALKTVELSQTPFPSPNTVEISRHSGMDHRNPDRMDAFNFRHPSSLDSGAPCRNDEENPNLTGLPLPFPQVAENGDKPNPVDMQREISRDKPRPLPHTPFKEGDEGEFLADESGKLTGQMPETVVARPLRLRSGQAYPGLLHPNLATTALPSHAHFKEEGFLADASGKLTGQMPEMVVARPLRLRSGQAYPDPHTNLNSATTPSLSMPMPQALDGETPNPTAMKEAGNRPSMYLPASAEPAMVPVDAIYSAIERSPPEFRMRTKPPAESPPVFTGQISPVPAFTGPVIHEDALPRPAPVPKFMPSDHSFPELDLAGTTKQPLKAMEEQIAQLQRALTDLTHQLDGQRARQQETTFMPPIHTKLNEAPPRSNAQSGHAFWERSYLNRSYRWSLR